MQKIIKLFLIISLAACGSRPPILKERPHNQSECTEKAPTTNINLEIDKKDEVRDIRLGQYAINAMYKTSARTKLSDVKKMILARAIVRVANDIFDSEENKRAFVTVLAIESEFARFAQSPTGPRGYAQVAKAAFKEGMAACGINDASDEDVWETDINLYAGACYFKKMLIRHNNDPFLAIVAYNQGPASVSAKMYSKNGTLKELEPLKYVAKFTFLHRTITDDKIPGVPDFSELPAPKAPKAIKK